MSDLRQYLVGLMPDGTLAAFETLEAGGEIIRDQHGKYHLGGKKLPSQIFTALANRGLLRQTGNGYGLADYERESRAQGMFNTARPVGAIVDSYFRTRYGTNMLDWPADYADTKDEIGQAFLAGKFEEDDDDAVWAILAARGDHEAAYATYETEHRGECYPWRSLNEQIKEAQDRLADLNRQMANVRLNTSIAKRPPPRPTGTHLVKTPNCYEIITESGLVYGTLLRSSLGWKVFPRTTARKNSRVPHPTPEAALVSFKLMTETGAREAVKRADYDADMFCRTLKPLAVEAKTVSNTLKAIWDKPDEPSDRDVFRNLARRLGFAVQRSPKTLPTDEGLVYGQAFKLLSDIARMGLKQGGEQYPNALCCIDMAQGLDRIIGEHNG